MKLKKINIALITMVIGSLSLASIISNVDNIAKNNIVNLDNKSQDTLETSDSDLNVVSDTTNNDNNLSRVVKANSEKLIKQMVEGFVSPGGKWANKTELSSDDLDGYTSIGQNAFENNKLTSVTIPNSVTFIGQSAFNNNKLTSVNIPNSVKSIEFFAFTSNNFGTSNNIQITQELLNTVCRDNGKTVRENFKQIFGVHYTNHFIDINPKATNDLSIWEMNAIVAGNTDISLLSRAFDGITEANFPTISEVKVLNGIITLTDSTGATISSIATTNTTTILTKELTDIYFAAGGIWAGKTDFSEVDLKGTTEIGIKTFFRKFLKSVVIPDSVTYIKPRAFYENELSSLTIPDSVTIIGERAFCFNVISDLKLGSNVIEIGSLAFNNNKLTSVNIPNSVKTIGITSFVDNKFPTDKSSVDISQELLNTICYWGLSSTDGKTVRQNFKQIFGIDYLIPSGEIVTKETNDLTIWEMNAIANGHKDIKLLSRAFDGITEANFPTISEVKVLNGIITLTNSSGRTVSSNASTNTNTILTKELVDKFFATGGIWVGKTIFCEAELKGTTEIGTSAFERKNLTSLTIPNSVTSIGEQAFSNNQITSLIIPSSLTSIGSNVFINNSIVSLTIPSSVTSIGYGAFKANHLTSLTIPNTVSFIAAYAFENNKLISVKIGSGVKTIGENAFGLNEFPSSIDIDITKGLLNSICSWNGKTVRENFKLIFGIDYLIPSGEIVTKETNDLTIWEMNAIAAGNRDITLLSRAFDNIDANNIETIKTAEVLNGIITLTNSAGSTVSSNASTNTTTILTKELTSKYLAVGGIWAGETIFGEDELKGTTEIGDEAFKDKYLASLTLVNTITKIGNTSFYNSELTSLILPDSVISLGERAFQMNKLTSLTISKNLKNITDSAFCYNKLTTVNIPNNITSIGKYSFYRNQISSLTFEKNNQVTSIGEYAFNNNKLTSVDIPNNITSIGFKAFIDNKDLTLDKIKISVELLNSTCDWGEGNIGNDKTVRQNFKLIFGVDYTNSFVDITPKATNDLSIWEMNVIAAGNINITLLSRAFDNIDTTNVDSIAGAEVLNGIITLKDTTSSSISSKASSNTTTILTKELTDIYFAVNGIWDGKTTFREADLKGTTEIGDSAFINKNLTAITLPNSLIAIGDNTFKGNQLMTITIPNNVIAIDNGAFVGNQFKTYTDIIINNTLLNSTCTWNGKTLKENFIDIFGVKYPKEVTPISAFLIDVWTLNAYKNGITVPSTVEFLSTAFIGIDSTNIHDITNVRINASNQIVITYDQKDITSGIPIFSTTILTKELTDKFFATGGIWDNKTRFNEADLKDTTEISDSAFINKNLTAITLPNSLKIIGKSAFNTNQLTSLIIPNSVASIGASAFLNNKFNSSEKIIINNTLLNSTCNWKDKSRSIEGDGKTIKENFVLIFGVVFIENQINNNNKFEQPLFFILLLSVILVLALIIIISLIIHKSIKRKEIKKYNN